MIEELIEFWRVRVSAVGALLLADDNTVPKVCAVQVPSCLHFVSCLLRPVHIQYNTI